MPCRRKPAHGALPTCSATGRSVGCVALLLMAHVAVADEHMEMPGVFGTYSMSREASGTSWQPEATPADGLMLMQGGWITMLHGYANQVYDHQGGPRGATENFPESMFMAMADRSWGTDWNIRKLNPIPSSICNSD